MGFFHRYRLAIMIATLAAAFSLVVVDYAEARRGGGFGSRGFRTFTKPAPTRTAPRDAQPINRSMTPRQQQSQPGGQAQGRAGAAQTQRGGMFGGMMGGLLGGLVLGGIVGMLLGNGFGGIAGFLALLAQIAIVFLIVSLVMRFLRNRREPAVAGGGGGQARARNFEFQGSVPNTAGGQDGARSTSPPVDVAPAGAGAHAPDGVDEIGLSEEDFDQFEQLLVEIQAAFTREDYAGLRARTTPEIVSYLSEELSENAVGGQRNDVTDVKLLQGDLSEAWREDNDEYATVAMRYESIDVMRDRTTGAVVDGVEELSETTEIWTFVRPVGSGRDGWKLSAIQDV
ncbi:MAG: Tim44 domain-containing protein [Pseudomonadota bacterium]